MRRILIIGRNSYIGKKIMEWLNLYVNDFEVNTISVRGEEWKNIDFSNFDVVFHTAGLAHIKETKENADLYFKVNRDLAYKVAEKAKRNGVKQYIFMSSMSVYGLDCGTINSKTLPSPKTNYGKSKLEAEKLILGLESQNFKIAIIRPPMIYGKESKGNFNRLVNLVLRLPIFPDIENYRSMLHIDNLCEFVRLLIINEDSGTFFPQNKEYVNTTEMARYIAEEKRKKIKFTKIFNLLFRTLGINLSVINKVFGTLIYEKKMSVYKNDYQIRNFRDSIKLSVRKAEDK